MKLRLYAVVGERTVKAVKTPDGGMSVLLHDWAIGEFRADRRGSRQKTGREISSRTHRKRASFSCRGWFNRAHYRVDALHRVAVGCSTVASLLVLGLGDDWAGPRSQTARTSAPAALVTDKFVLLTTSRRFLLQFHSREEKKQVAIPWAWLVPPQEERDEEHEYVSSFQYDNWITSFAIGHGKIGLQLSSFALMPDGSAQAAAGRDVFLVFDPESAVIEKGLTTLGITKARVRDDGCFRAQTAHFLIADIDRDGLTDIGVVRESIRCHGRSSNQDSVRGVQPEYSQQPVQWFVYRKGRWQVDRAHRGTIPIDATALPLIGMELGPVDYVGYGYWKSHDPAKWGSTKDQPVRYQPPYRKQLIKRGARAVSAPP